MVAKSGISDVFTLNYGEGLSLSFGLSVYSIRRLTRSEIQ